MKIAATLTALTLGLSTAGFAYADSLSSYPADPAAATSASTLTRTQVQQALQQAQAAGLVIIGENSASPALVHSDSKTRSEILSDLHSAQSAGLVHTGEQIDYPAFAA